MIQVGDLVQRRTLPKRRQKYRSPDVVLSIRRRWLLFGEMLAVVLTNGSAPFRETIPLIALEPYVEHEE